MSDWPLLSLTTFLPLVGAGFVLLIRGEAAIVAQNARAVALWTALATFALSLMIWAQFDPAQGGFQLVEQGAWLEPLGIRYAMGVDGISLWLVLLSTLLTVVVIVGSWHSVTERVKEYMVTFLIMDTLMVGTFCALDIVLFYVFFEGILIPMYLIIGIWGGPRRIYSAFKFFLYTLAGSVLFLVAIIVMAREAGTTSIPELARHDFPVAMQTWLWLALFASFAVKVPMWPFHTWLPDAHVEAPTAGSVILAGVLLKMGTYGFLRFCLPLFPNAALQFTPLISILAIIGILYGAWVSMVQPDLKKLVAYSSVSHLGFVMLGIFTLTHQGLQGGLLQMVNHGLSTGALFLIVGMIYERRHTRMIEDFGGLAKQIPVFTAFFMIVTLSSIGLPGLNGFVGEFLVLIGTFLTNKWYAVLATSGVIFAAVYMLRMFQRVMFGKLEKEENQNLADLSKREIAVLVPIVAMIILIGVWPQPFLNKMEKSVDHLIRTVHYRAERVQQAPALLPVDFADTDLNHQQNDEFKLAKSQHRKTIKVKMIESQ
jgi:NADH-quinone oxidoreductase subunit M